MMTKNFPADVASLIAADASHDDLMAALASGGDITASGHKIVSKEVYYTDSYDGSCKSGWRRVRCVKLTYDDGDVHELCGRGSCV